jgi:hypothetical protein
VVVGLGRRSKAIGDVAAEDEKNDVALVGVDTVDDVADGTEEPTLSSRQRIGAIPRLIRKSSPDGEGDE